MQYVLISVAIMAVVTYLPRMLPLAIFKKKITNPWVKSFLAYVPYAVLAAMTFPAILYATSSLFGFGGLAGGPGAGLLQQKPIGGGAGFHRRGFCGGTASAGDGMGITAAQRQ